jgi:hypothetical protein
MLSPALIVLAASFAASIVTSVKVANDLMRLAMSCRGTRRLNFMLASCLRYLRKLIDKQTRVTDGDMNPSRPMHTCAFYPNHNFIHCKPQTAEEMKSSINGKCANRQNQANQQKGEEKGENP